jgi:hypothetical protein
MNSNQRACIAGIANAIVNNKKINSVYSYELSTHISISGTVSASNINIFDHSRSCHISGSGNGEGKYSLFDYGLSKHITLNIKNEKFDGFDYMSNKHFSGTVCKNSVNLYDYETGRYYDFSC